MINILIFLAYTSLFLKVIKLIWEKYKNVSNGNYTKLINYLSKMKELNQIIFQKELFASIKGHFWQKGTWTIQKDRWRLNSADRKVFLINFIYI